jgi:short-subunit dehydrogenase
LVKHSFKTVWITGASSGLGRALSLELARRGCKVAATARSVDGLDELSREAENTSGSVFAIPGDVTNQTDMTKAYEAAKAALGPIDLVVCNAGIFIPTRARGFSADTFAKHLDVNLQGVANTLEPVLPDMMARKGGHIAIVSSVAGYRGLPKSAAYGATKAGLINMAEALKYDLDAAGVKLQLICPGFVKTPLTDKNDFPMPFLMPVDKAIVRMIAGLESRRFEITFPRRLSWVLKHTRILPYGLYFWITKKVMRP